MEVELPWSVRTDCRVATGVVGVAGVGNVFDEAARVSSGSAGRDEVGGPDDIESGAGDGCTKLASPLANCAEETLLAFALLS